MNKIIITLVMFLASISFSQVNTVYYDGTDCNCDSIHQVYDDNGSLMDEAPYVNGKKNGIEKGYFPSGTLTIEIPFVNGKKNGIEKGYHGDGSLWYEVPYVNGKKNGIEKEYYYGGNFICLETSYVNGKKNGIENEYLENGRLVSSTKYKNNVLEGEYKYCINGKRGNADLKCNN